MRNNPKSNPNQLPWLHLPAGARQEWQRGTTPRQAAGMQGHGDVGSWQPGGSRPHMFPLEQGTGDKGLFTGINNWMARGGFLSLRQPELGREGEKKGQRLFLEKLERFVCFIKNSFPR